MLHVNLVSDVVLVLVFVFESERFNFAELGRLIDLRHHRFDEIIVVHLDCFRNLEVKVKQLHNTRSGGLFDHFSANFAQHWDHAFLLGLC